MSVRRILRSSLWASLLPSVATMLEAQTGQVLANGVPVPGATVKASKGEVSLVTLTDEAGRYKLDGITDGQWTLEVKMFRFGSTTKELEVKGPFEQNFELKLAKPMPAAVSDARPRPGGENGPQLARRGGPGQAQEEMASGSNRSRRWRYRNSPTS
jgi:hypothetical protein